MPWKIRTNPEALMKMRKKTQRVRAITRPFFSLVRPWVAGKTAVEAMEKVKQINSKGGKGLLNFLGEHYKDPELVVHAIREYQHLIRGIAMRRAFDARFNSSVSIKPSQFGFDLEFENPGERNHIVFENMRSIAREAVERQVPIEIDMEHSAYTDFTLRFFKSMLQEFGSHATGLRVCLQANLKRTEKDLQDLVALGKKLGIKPGVRLVKGVYPEKENPNAFHSNKEIIQNFARLVELAFQNGQHLNIAIGTHRRDIVEQADRLSKQTGIPYELQMLKGIGFEIKRERYAGKKGLTEYVPYGRDAIPYGWRRAKKMSKMLLGSFLDLLHLPR